MSSPGARATGTTATNVASGDYRMTEEPSTDTSNAATVPEAVLRQKTPLAETTFAFYPERLDYSYANSQGTRVERRIGWNFVPPSARLRRNEEPDRRVKRLLRLGIIFSILIYAALFRIHLGPLLILTGYAIAFCLLTVLLSRHLRTRNAVLPTTQGNIVILGDAEHDAILERVLEGRRA